MAHPQVADRTKTYMTNACSKEKDIKTWGIWMMSYLWLLSAVISIMIHAGLGQMTHTGTETEDNLKA